MDLVIAAAAAWLLLAAVAEASAPRPARVCSSCHGEIRKQWEASSMAQSWRNPVFQAFLADAKAALGDSTRLACISCHAPLASVTGDAEVVDPVSQEGVTCNFCHNVSAVDPSPKPASYTYDPSNPNLMRGPRADADAGSAHEFAYSEIQTKSEFCAACHSYGDEQAGLFFEPTYVDWKGSKAAQAGKQCQDCHMPTKVGKASAIAKKTRDDVRQHLFVGAHGAGALDSTATLAAAVEGGRVKLTVTNTRAGHALPGGSASMRMIALDVVFRGADGKEVGRVTADRYGIEFADSAGKSPVPKWLAKKVARSNPIPANGTVTAWADIPAGAKRAESELVFHFIHPAYRGDLEKRQVDLARSAPAVMTRAAVDLP
jgi:predicted CxxxxCH...CXXCH cytochrome family protein